MTRHWKRTIRAEMRDVQVLLRESWVALVLFALVLLVGSLLLFRFYISPATGQRIGLGEAVYGTFSLIFFNPYLSFPGREQWFLRLLYYIIPVLGLGALADGVLRFGVALVNKRDRGQKWQVAMASTYSDHIIVCGVGKVGYRVVKELLGFGREVVAIESNPEGPFVEKAMQLGIPVLIANARRSINLIKAGVEKADAIIPCTDDELTNLDIALDAREINPGIKVVLRMFDPDLARRVEKGFGIHTAFSTSALAAPVFATASMRLNVKHSFYVGERLLNVSEMIVGPESRLVGWSLERVQTELDLTVVSHRVGEESSLHPDLQRQVAPGQTLLVLGSLEAIKRLHALNMPAGTKRR